MFRILYIVAAFSLCLIGPLESMAQHRYIVKYRQQAGVQRFGASLGSLGGQLRENLPLINGEVFELNRALSQAELSSFAAAERARIEYIEPDHALTTFERVPNDQFFSEQWGSNNTGGSNFTNNVDLDLPEAWDYSTGSAEPVVAVLDTGVDYTHPDLVNNLWRNPYEIPNNGLDDDFNGFIDDQFGVNLITNTGDPFDDQGHGTQVSGVIGAEGNNGIGVAGVNWSSRVLNIKVLDSNGSGFTANIVRAVHYAIEAKLFKGTNVVAINLSLGGGNFSQAMYDALERARRADITIIAAAGNESNNIDVTPSYPAAYDLDNIISVASIDQLGGLSSFSNYGHRATDVAAPGSNVLTTTPQWSTPEGYAPYRYVDGTSFSAPYVAGVVSLLHSRVPNLTYRSTQDAIYRTLKTWRDVPALGSIDGIVGLDGVVNANEAILYAINKELDSDGDGVSDRIENARGTNPLDRGNFNLDLASPAYTKYNTFLNQQNYLELIAVSVKPVEAEVNIFAIDGSLIHTVPVNLRRSEQYHLDINAIVGRSDTYGIIRVDFNEAAGGELYGRLTSYRPDTLRGGFAFAFTREFRNPIHGESHVTSNSYDPQGTGRAVENWIELINLDELPLVFTHNIYTQDGRLVKTQQLQVPAFGELDVQGGHEFGQGVFLNELVPHNPRANYFAALTRYRLNEQGNDYSYAFSFDALAATGAEKYIPTFNRTGGCFTQTNWIEVVNTTSEPAPVTLTFRNSDSSLASQQGITIPPKAQIHFNATAMLASGSTGWVAVTPWAPESIISQGLVYYHDCRSNVLQTAFGVASSEPHSNVLQGTFNQNLGMDNIISMINTQAVAIDQGVIDMYFPQGRYRYGFPLVGLGSTIGFLNVEESWAANTYGTLEVLGSLFPASKMVVHNLLERDRGDGRIDYVIPTSVK